MNKPIGLTKAGQYEIRVKSVLDPRWQSWFEGMTSTAGGNETISSGTVADQVALHSVLTRIRDLGRPRMAVNQIKPEESA